MPKQTQILFAYGKLNSVILLMELKLLSINSLYLEKPNGMSRTVLLCCFLMDMMELVQSIHHAELRDIFKCAIKMKLFHLMESIMTTKTSLEKLTFKL
jgi:hypothetical protein